MNLQRVLGLIRALFGLFILNIWNYADRSLRPAISKMDGTVKWFNTKKGYGFISGDDGKDYFVHHTAVPEGAYLNEGDPVSFEPAQSDRGPQAQKVTLKK